MKNNILSTFIIGVTLLLAGCSYDMTYEPEIAGTGDSILNIDIDMEESSRAPITSTSFREGDEVFVIVTDSNNPDPLTVTTKATYTGGVWVMADKINLSGNISGVEWTQARVEVYYPYSTIARSYNSATRKIELTNIIGLQDDILCGSGYASKSASKVTVHCRHALTRLTLALKNNSNEKAAFDTITVRNQGVQSFLGYSGTLNSDGISVSNYTNWMKRFYNSKMVIPAGETFYFDYLLPPTVAAYDMMQDYMSKGEARTVLKFELALNDKAVYFDINADIWREGNQYTYPVNLFKSSEPEPVENEYVDLGLPSGTKWCTHNVGASAPEEYGGYYAWGETEEKSMYNYNNYAYYNNATQKFFNIGAEISGSQYDVAHAVMGGSWRMPTLEQIEELIDYCTWKWTQLDGVNGQLVTGPNGGQIFLPAAGSRRDGDLVNAGWCGYYWSGSLRPDWDSDVFMLNFGSENWFWSLNRRFYGQSVRAVCP